MHEVAFLFYATLEAQFSSSIRTSAKYVTSVVKFGFFSGSSTGFRFIFIWKESRPVVFVVQVMSDVSKQECVHNRRIPQCNKMRIRSNYQLL